MRAKDVLLTALQEYNGTVVFVSHDRYFIDNLATRVIEVAAGEEQRWLVSGVDVDQVARRLQLAVEDRDEAARQAERRCARDRDGCVAETSGESARVMAPAPWRGRQRAGRRAGASGSGATVGGARARRHACHGWGLGEEPPPAPHRLVRSVAL